MQSAAKYTFDTEFRTDGDLVSAVARGRQKKSLTQEELDEVCAEARTEGMNAGQVRAQEAIAAAAHDAAQAIAAALAQIAHDYEVLRSEAADIALAAARKLARSALAALPAAEVEAMLREAMHQAIGEPRILLRAAPAVAEAISRHLTDIAHEEGYDGRVQISADPSLKDADCRIEWRGGGAERAESTIEAAIADLIARRFAIQEITKEQSDVGR
ncbi:MAG TPA: FliH/SctL family protein [Rhizomicrobium sp.]